MTPKTKLAKACQEIVDVAEWFLALARLPTVANPPPARTEDLAALVLLDMPRLLRGYTLNTLPNVERGLRTPPVKVELQPLDTDRVILGCEPFWWLLAPDYQDAFAHCIYVNLVYPESEFAPILFSLYF